MKLAVISDLHGNYYALAKVLAFLRSQEIDGIIGLGDFVTDGPFPQRMMRVLREMQEEFPCYLVRGNREEYLLENIRKIGDIIYVPLDEEDGLILKDGYKDRNKYIVIIGFTPEGVAIGALLINSEIDSSKRSEELLDCQYPLMVRNYRDILDYDSWLDCSDIFELSKLKITEKNGKLKGCLISEDRVMQFLRETEVFDNATKRRYGIIK